jgi:hypothetical protein
MLKTTLILTILILISPYVQAQSSVEVVVPEFNDIYSKYVTTLEAGHTDIDYREFRYSFIESKQFQIASEEFSRFDSLKKQLFARLKQPMYSEIIALCKQILSIDYTSLMTHKLLRQSYEHIGDTLHAKQYKAIQFGLLKSIVANADGTTHETAWPVIQIAEEYFILQMLGAEMHKQTTERDGGMFDKLEVIEDGKEKTYYFEVSKVFEGYNRLGLK